MKNLAALKLQKSSKVSIAFGSASKKGLIVRKYISSSGRGNEWSITRPNGGTYFATSDSDMIDFILNY